MGLASGPRVVNGYNVHMRSGKGTNYDVIATVSKGESVYYLNVKESGGKYTVNGVNYTMWAKVQYSNKEGWMAAQYLSMPQMPSNALIFRSKKPKGFDEYGNKAEDMMFSDYTKREITNIYGYFSPLWCLTVNTTAEVLFSEFKSASLDMFTQGELTDVVSRMIDHFANGTGTVFNDSTLTKYVKNHQTTQAYINFMKELVINTLSTNGGDITDLLTNTTFQLKGV